MVLASRVLPAIALLSCLSATRARPLCSQTLPKLAPGTRVRVTTPDPRLRPAVGVVLAVHDDTMSIQGDDNRPTRFAASSVRRIETSLGTRNHIGTGAAIGLFSGAALGAATGLATARFLEQVFGGTDRTRGDFAAVGALWGGIGGAGIGALIGWAKRTEDWEEVPMQTSPRVAAFVGGTGIGVAIQF